MTITGAGPTTGYPSGEPSIEPGHVGRDIAACAQCQTRDGWQTTSGMRYAAQVIRHEAVTEEELDLAELCEYVSVNHYPVDGKCVACGDTWNSADVYPDLGELQCQVFLDTRIEKNFWIMRKVWRMRAKWAKVDTDWRPVDV